jgi:hypothetical protein
MNIEKFLFPHPILGKTGNYRQEFIPEKPVFKSENGVYEIRFHLNLEGFPDLKNWVKNCGVLICEVTCSYTMYRKVFKAENNGLTLEFRINQNDLRNKVELLFLVVAKNEINDFSPEEIADIYFPEGKHISASWKLKEGDVLVFAGNRYIHIDSQGNKPSDFFRFSRQADDNKKTIEYQLEKDFIRITIPGSRYDAFSNLKDIDEVQDIIVSSVVVPALYYVLSIFTDFEGAREKFDSFEWFQFLERKIMKYMDSTEAGISFEDIPFVVDNLLSGSEENLIRSILSLVANENSDDEP